jgi:NAD-dependent deacetylase
MGDADFTLTPELDAQIAEAAQMLRAARSAIALTGAGLSVESGIPPFRGPGGLWTKYGEPPLDGYQRFIRDPAKAWRDRLNPKEPWAIGLAETLAAAKPNAGHRALAALEDMDLLDTVITQNVDDLHGQAGQRSLLEIHGNHYWLRCLECHQRFHPKAIAVDPNHLPPLCAECGGIVKGDTVSFGEPIPPSVLRACVAAADSADCALVVGTSATVYPAAEFPFDVLRRGGRAIEVNPYESEFTRFATVSLQGPAGAVLTRLVEHAQRLAA